MGNDIKNDFFGVARYGYVENPFNNKWFRKII